jgi:hypothetical protein
MSDAKARSNKRARRFEIKGREIELKALKLNMLAIGSSKSKQ